MKRIVLYENLGQYAFAEPYIGQPETVIGSSDTPVVGDSEQPVSGESDAPVIGDSEQPVVGESEAPVVGESVYVVLGDSGPVLGTSDNPCYVLGASGYTVAVSNFPEEKPVSERPIVTFTPTEFFLFCILLWMVSRDILKLFMRKWGVAEW